MEAAATVGVFGGSGFYDFLDGVEYAEVETPFGSPSAPIAIGEVADIRVAFLPRHGPRHEMPAHRVNYRANIHAFHQLGVRQIIGPFSCGSLQPEIHPGDFLIPDQFIDRTRGRQDTFFDGPEVRHIGAAQPYCGRLRAIAVEAGAGRGLRMHDEGTVVVIQGPRFSTTAESLWFSREGWHVVNMTQYPEAILAREMGICYTGVALVTDYDAGVGEGRGEVSIEDVLRVFRENIGNVRDLIAGVIPRLTGERSCDCEAQARQALFA